MKNKEIKLSPEFRTQTSKAILSILLFVVTYIILLLCTISLTIFCVYMGLMLIVTFPKLFTIALGVGLASLGFFILIFLVKFLFKSNKVDRSDLVEITEADEPELFKLINHIVAEVGTTFPKKVYLSTNVNAAVFYDSSFWSMFFPIRKNLQIGLGLVNTVSRVELTAILAHEFGHFSQKTMKVGSYVYNVNQVIFNMLNDNESYNKLIQRWANVTAYFSIFISIAVKIIVGIQWILGKMYEIVNKSYMALSREMEFHADEIAANVTGSAPLQTSLLRISLADQSFNTVLSHYDKKIPDSLKSANVFQEHLFVMNFVADYNGFPIKQNLPELSIEELNKFKRSKLVIKDQWSSHPSTEERIERLKNLNIPTVPITETPANSIFRDIEKTQKELTNLIFKDIQYDGDVKLISFDDFKSEYKQQYLGDSFSKVYNGYYDSKDPSHFEFADHQTEVNVTVDELFSDEKVGLVYSAIALQNDIEALKQISDKTITVKTFDYDGQKYKRKEAAELISTLSLELEEVNAKVRAHDITIYHYYKKKEPFTKNVTDLEGLYRRYFQLDKSFEISYQLYVELMKELQFLQESHSYEQIEIKLQELAVMELKLKNGIRQIFADDIYTPELTQKIRDDFELYLSQQLKYFDGTAYNDHNLNILFTAAGNYAFLLGRGLFLMKKQLLAYQENLG